MVESTNLVDILDRHCHQYGFFKALNFIFLCHLYPGERHICLVKLKELEGVKVIIFKSFKSSK